MPDPFTVGQAWSAAPDINEVGILDYATGLFTPVVTGLDSPHGEGFITNEELAAVGLPLPSSGWTTLLGLGLAVAISLAIKRKRSAAV